MTWGYVFITWIKSSCLLFHTILPLYLVDIKMSPTSLILFWPCLILTILEFFFIQLPCKKEGSISYASFYQPRLSFWVYLRSLLWWQTLEFEKSLHSSKLPLFKMGRGYWKFLPENWWTNEWERKNGGINEVQSEGVSFKTFHYICYKGFSLLIIKTQLKRS